MEIVSPFSRNGPRTTITPFDEYYWVAEKAVPAAEAAGFVVRYEQISSCGGIYVIELGET